MYVPYDVASHLVIACDIILNNLVISNWVSISQCKQKLIDKKNQNKNKTANRTIISYSVSIYTSVRVNMIPKSFNYIFTLFMCYVKINNIFEI